RRPTLGSRRLRGKARPPRPLPTSPGSCWCNWRQSARSSIERVEETAMPLTSDEEIYELLANSRTIAMVGASDRPDRASHGVMQFLQDRGYRVIPVNPQITGQHLHG